jgi:hypothetical protein
MARLGTAGHHLARLVLHGTLLVVVTGSSSCRVRPMIYG